MKGIKKIIAIALMAAMTISFAACGEPTEEKKNDDKSNTSQTAQISDGNSETPESSVPEDIELSNPQSEAESKNSDGTSSNPESQTSNSDGTQTSSKQTEASQTSKPATSNQTSSESESQANNTSSNGTQTSKPVETSQASKPQTSNQNTSSNGTQSSKPTETSQTSKPQTSNNTQTSKPTETKPAPKPSVQSITLNKTSLTLTVGQTAKLSYSISPSNAEAGKITWTWSDSKVVSVSGDGTVTAKAAGKANITIKTSNGKSATCNVTVKEKQQTSKPSKKVNVEYIDVEDVTLLFGQSCKAKYSTIPANAVTGKITWRSEDPDIADVSSDGTITATARRKHSYGDYQTIIWATAENGVTHGCCVKVVEPITGKSQAEINKIYSAFQAPYEGKVKGWQDTVISYLREVGEKKYNMKWEDSFYVRDKGYTYNCGFNFPISNFDDSNGQNFRMDCLYQFEELERQLAKNGEDIADGYTRFKIVIEDLGVDKYRGEHEFFVYLCYG